MKKIVLLSLFLFFIVGCQSGKVESENQYSKIEKYQVLSDFELIHQAYLSEGISFYQEESKKYVLGYGHIAHAMSI